MGYEEHRLRLVAEPDSITALLDWLEARTEIMALSPKVAYRLATVCEELASNIVSHGAAGGAGFFAVTLERRDAHVAVRMEDDGPAFDPLARAEPQVDTPLDARSIGGLGVHLVRTMVETIDYARGGDRNRVDLLLAAGD